MVTDCPKCLGNGGFLWYMEWNDVEGNACGGDVYEECPVCHGYEKVIPCIACHETGLIDELPCPVCHGHKVVSAIAQEV